MEKNYPRNTRAQPSVFGKRTTENKRTHIDEFLVHPKTNHSHFTSFMVHHNWKSHLIFMEPRKQIICEIVMTPYEKVVPSGDGT